MLLRLDASVPGRALAEAQEQSNLMAKLGEGPIVGERREGQGMPGYSQALARRSVKPSYVSIPSLAMVEAP
jgi:hypothetical protein